MTMPRASIVLLFVFAGCAAAIEEKADPYEAAFNQCILPRAMNMYRTSDPTVYDLDSQIERCRAAARAAIADGSPSGAGESQ